MARPISPESRTRLLDAAERLFHERGYSAVSMADIAEATGIRKASLYHHVPGGKEELFVEVSVRTFERHKEGMSKALAQAEAEFKAQLQAASRWMIDHAPLGLLAMLQNDMPELTEEHATGLSGQLMISLWQPLTQVFEAAKERGEIRMVDADTFVGAFISMMDGLTYIGTTNVSSRPMEEVADELIDMMLYGLKA
jgi:AcrR family transcriptional regulator